MDLYFRILERLSNGGIGEDVDITSEFDNYLLNFKDPLDAFYGERIDKIKEFLNVMKTNKHLTYEDLSPPANKELSEEEKEKYRKEIRVYQWVKPIKITGKISNEGLDYYYNHILKQATIASYKDQKLNNGITWGIAIGAIVISTLTTVWLGISNNSLDKRVLQLERGKKTTTEKTTAPSYHPKHIDTLHKIAG